ncbi:MAG: hypothetical protein J5873_02305 [Bacteroidales bacterium]|nr:hypothetical protein [Bacteroidales bacterium]
MKKIVFTLSVLAVLATACGTLKQLSQITNLKNCNFSLKSVESVQVAGINVKNLKSLTATDLVNLAACLSAKKLPVSLGVSVGVENPGTEAAALTRMEWVCTVDDKALANGIVNEKHTIPAQSMVSVPLRVNMDAYELFSSTGVDAVKAFIQSFSAETDNSLSSRVAVKVKPTLTLGSATITFPNYITLLSNK